MAESILFNVVANIVTKLASPAVKELGLLWGVNKELEKLDDTLSAIQAVLVDAEEQQSKSHRVKNWVSKLKDVVYEIEDLMDECAYRALEAHVLAKDQRKRKQVRRLFSKLIKRPYFKLELAHQIKDIRERLQAIDEDKKQFNFSELVLDTSVSDDFKKKRETYSFVLEEDVIGRSNDKEEIINKHLLNTNTKDDIAIISIVGMGGLGKTTLAQYVYNDDRITNHFELKLWVCVSQVFEVKIIVENIIESATKKKPKSSLQMDSLANELRKQIDGKKYLLVMDDVWNKDYKKWNDLKQLLMSGAQGSRILITTRDENVAKIHDATFSHSLEKLDDFNSWLLFEKMAFSEGHGQEFENSNLIDIGREIVAKLRGVPLVIRTIGQLLKEKKPHFWSSFKDKELCQVIEEEKNVNLDYILSILKLSYKHLSPNLKQCFLYCALFPKDYVIQKDELIILWRAQGFIRPNDKDELIDIGEDYFLELLSKSFFQEVTYDGSGNIKTCKMHDLMHDLACLVTKNEFTRGLENNMDKRTYHFSFSSISHEEFREVLKTLSKARNLRTFLMLDQYSWVDLESRLDKFFLDNYRLRTLKVHLYPMEKGFWSIIGRFKHLRYLLIWGLNLKYLPNGFTKLYNLETLSLGDCNGLKRLPCDIKNLINLKHLELSSVLPLKFLPKTISELGKLEELRISYCDIEELPRDIKKLVNLKHLDIRDCLHLAHMPKGLSELTNLQTLSEFVLGNNNNGSRLNELEGLNKLNGCLTIRNLKFFSDIDLQMKAMILQQKKNLRQLHFEWVNKEVYQWVVDPSNEPTIDVYERVLDILEPHSNLENITIVGYGGVKLCKWLSSGSLGCLVTICLIGCERLEHLPQFDQLPCLKKLSLEFLPSIEFIVNDDSISSSTLFPSLEKLKILGMPKLKRWLKSRTSTESNKPTGDSFSIKFPSLSQLKIDGCDVRILMSIYTPSLKLLSIGDLVEHPIEKDEFDVAPWKIFENLSSLSLSYFSKLEYLPKCLQRVTTLQYLLLNGCRNLKSLPEWIDNLTSLRQLEIYYCEKLAAMPEGIRHIQGLQLLDICGCPILQERCVKYIGEDWPKIAHIPRVDLKK